ncbi:AAA family ATPase [bacterium]|nr:AAA family ATPase [bacterium]
MIQPINAVTNIIPKYRNNFRQNSDTVSDDFYIANQDSYQQEKLRILKTGVIVLGSLGAAIAISHGISAIKNIAELSIKKKPSAKKVGDILNISAVFENISSNIKIPELKDCKSLNKILKDLLQTQVDVKQASKELLEKTGAKPINMILLSGKPGTGKSFFGKVYAKTIGAEYMQVEYPDMNSRWAGEGVEKMDAIFKYISETGKGNPDKNYVVVFNEIDAVLQPVEIYANNSLGGHMLTKMEQRATFLEYLEKVSEETPNVTIIGTTNLCPHKNGIDSAAVSRFQHVYEVPMPDKDNLYEALKMNLALLSDGDNFIKSNDLQLRELASRMEEKQCSFRDLNNIVERSTGYYLREVMRNKDVSYRYEFLTRALDNHGITDGMTKS